MIVDRARHRADDPEAPAGPVRATPLLLGDLRAMVAALDLTSAAGLRDRGVILLGWAMAGRRSEIAGLNIADIRDADRRTVRYRPPIEDRHAGPLFVRVDRRGNVGGACGGRYRGLERTGRLTGQAIAAIITAAATVAGLDRPPADPLDDTGPKRFTGHSARRGCVTTALARKDADAAAIAGQGRRTRGSRAFWDYYEPDWDEHPGDGLL